MNPNNGNPTGQPNVHVSQTTVLDLNTDCLLQIFRYFTAEEMAIASDVCQQFKDVANVAFKYEWKSVSLILNDRDQYSKMGATAILRHFGHQLQKIFINFSEKWIEHIFGMVIEKCSSEQLTEVFYSQKIIDQKNIDRFRSKFTNLKSIGLGNTPPKFCVDLDEHFPTVEKLTLFGYKFKNEQVVQCVSLHPQLKSLQLEYIKPIERLRILLESVDQHLPQLEELSLTWIPGDVAETRYEPKFFKNLKRLKFHNFGKGHLMQHLSISNSKLEQLQLEEGTYNSGVAKFICNYKELRKLSIHEIDCPMDYKDLLKLNDHLSNLVDFEISSNFRNINHEAIIEFVLNSKQLVTLTIEDRKMGNIAKFKNILLSKLDTTKWAVDCCFLDNKLKIRKLSNGNH